MPDEQRDLRLAGFALPGGLVGFFAARPFFQMVFEGGGPLVFLVLPVLLVGIL